jgi:hypothetical protein
LKVYKECCKNCLLSQDRIVSSARAKEIINGCVKDQSYFICHKATMKDTEVVCATFYKTLGYKSQLIRIMQRIDGIEFIEQPDAERLPSFADQRTGTRQERRNDAEQRTEPRLNNNQ